MYFIKTPWWLKKVYPALTWSISTGEKNLYLSFDDGPHETATPFVLDQLKNYNAKASFFCIGKNVLQYPGIYRRIIDEGHKVCNHTQNHLNGWKTDNTTYIKDIFEAAKFIDSNLFRPPYGKITRFQARLLDKPDKAFEQQEINTREQPFHRRFRVIMWDVLTGDFDTKITPQQCLKNALRAESGSIIVFHDSTKAWSRMSFALPKMLEYFSEKGFRFKPLEEKED